MDLSKNEMFEIIYICLHSSCCYHSCFITCIAYISKHILMDDTYIINHKLMLHIDFYFYISVTVSTCLYQIISSSRCFSNNQLLK